MRQEEQLASLPDDLGFVLVDDATMLGEPEGVPATITVLDVAPLALMFQFRIDPNGTQAQIVSDLLDGATEDEATVEINGNVAIFSMYELPGTNNESIGLLIKHIASTLSSTDFAIDPGCLKCGEVESAELLYAGGRPTRLCEACHAEAIELKEKLEEHLNRPTRASSIVLLGAVIYGFMAWGLFWAVIDIALHHWQINVIELNRFTSMLGLMVIAAVGFGVGHPIGHTVSRSIALQKIPRLSGFLIALGVTVAGEVLMLTLLLLYDFGIFDLWFTIHFVGTYVSRYSGFWILCKLTLSGSIWFFCSDAAAKRRTAILGV